MLNSAEHEIDLLINVKMPTIVVGILTFISMIKTSERLKARNFLICQYFSFLRTIEISCQLSMKFFFINLGQDLEIIRSVLENCNCMYFFTHHFKHIF